MAVGDSSLYSGESYVAIGRETTFGTGVTATAFLPVTNFTLKTVKDTKPLEQIERKRALAKSLRLGKVVEGDVGFYAYPELTAVGYILQNAFGGTVTSATATGETTGGGAFTHTFETGSMDQTYKSLTTNSRRGPSSGGKVFEYIGGRINQLSIAAEIDEPLMLTASMICKDSTVGATDVETNLTITTGECLSFEGGRFSIDSSLGAITTTAFWHVQSINAVLGNSLKNDAGSRRIGSDTLDVLPPGLQTNDLSVTMRFNTTTAYDAMMNSTRLAGEFEFLGTTISGSAVRRSLKFQYPHLEVKDASEPEITGPDEQLTSTVVFGVKRDDSTSTGYAVRGQLTNAISSY